MDEDACGASRPARSQVAISTVASTTIGTSNGSAATPGDRTRVSTAVAGPDIVTVNGANSSTVPAAVAVALFAAVATWPIARYGFAQRRKTSLTRGEPPLRLDDLR